MAASQVIADYQALTAAEQEQVRQQLLPSPVAGGLTAVWLTVIIIVGIVAIGAGYLAYQLLDDEKDAEAIIALSSAALGGLIGLLVPSPVAD